MIKILLLTRYGYLGASSRMRSLQYVPWLQGAGIEVTTVPLFSDFYVNELQQGRRKAVEIVRSYSRRLARLLNTRGFDLLWIEKELFPWLPARLDALLFAKGRPYVLDYDDAVFHYYDQHPWSVLRKLLGEKHRDLINGAALVVAGNEYLASYARDAGAAQVEVVPTVIDLQRYSLEREPATLDVSGVPCVGWIGQRATANFLRPLAPLFERLSKQGKGRFAAIGIDAQQLDLPMVSVPWSEDTEVASLKALDVGIMPLLDGPFERGKCGYKLIQYMACGLPVVASPVGVNRQIVEHGVNGFLAETPREWETSLECLLADPLLRQRMGAAGRAKVERSYSIQVTAPRLTGLLKDAANRDHGGGA